MVNSLASIEFALGVTAPICVVIAIGAALALVAVSTGIALVTGEVTYAELGNEWFG